MDAKGTEGAPGKAKKSLEVFLDWGNTPLKGQRNGLRAWAGSQEPTITQLIFEEQERRSSSLELETD